MRMQLTVRIEPHTWDYIARIAEDAGRMSFNQVAAALLERAEAEGWTVQPGSSATAIPHTSAPGTPLTIATPGADPDQEG